uniref:Ribosomal protein S4 n=1 Tax=Petalonia binghamiae TaxID=698476 RepID=A0A2H4ZQZ2_9PHAE|nr:ribosomal protein S4 [Endarachne binghamiae]AUG32965.1 ribosomal protein S4 [Endarachne binghamiae]AZJ13600.1 ribosomal protein S4 [Endarachne binghamiae]
MRFKNRYKSCLWSKTNIWGDLLAKEESFLRPKWDSMIAILRSQKRRHRPLVNINRYRHPICNDYKYLKPRSRANQVFKYNRIGYRNTLSLLLCLRRFYGDLNHKSFKNFCRPAFRSKDPSQSLLSALEGRLDICLYRLGFFHSIYYSRQAIIHNKVLINGKKIGHCGFILQKGDYVEFCASQRPAIKTRLVARFKRFRSSYIRLERWRLPHRYKLQLHLQPTPKWIQTDYSNLSFIISSEVSTSVMYPFRANIDEALWASKYAYI